MKFFNFKIKKTQSSLCWRGAKNEIKLIATATIILLFERGKNDSHNYNVLGLLIILYIQCTYIYIVRSTSRIKKQLSTRFVSSVVYSLFIHLLTSPYVKFLQYYLQKTALGENRSWNIIRIVYTSNAVVSSRYETTTIWYVLRSCFYYALYIFFFLFLFLKTQHRHIIIVCNILQTSTRRNILKGEKRFSTKNRVQYNISLYYTQNGHNNIVFISNIYLW